MKFFCIKRDLLTTGLCGVCAFPPSLYFPPLFSQVKSFGTKLAEVMVTMYFKVAFFHEKQLQMLVIIFMLNTTMVGDDNNSN